MTTLPFKKKMTKSTKNGEYEAPVAKKKKKRLEKDIILIEFSRFDRNNSKKILLAKDAQRYMASNFPM